MTTASPDDIELPAVWSQIRRRVPRLLIASLVLGALTYVVLSLTAPRYESEAQLQIVAKGVSDPFSSPQKDGLSQDSVTVRMDKEAVNTHVRALLSPDLSQKLIAEMSLNDRVEFNAALGAPDVISRVLRLAGIGAPRPGESEEDRVQSKFYEKLEVYSPKESRAINIRFTSSDPNLAADVANKLAETYREALAKATVIETDEVQKALEPKVEKLKEELSSAEAAIEKFRGEANIFKGGQQSTGLNEQQLAELTAELSKAKAARSEADARTKSAKEMFKSGSADALPDVQKSPLVQNLVQQRVGLERQISELSATLLPGHPRMQQINADLAGLKKQITAEVAKVVESLEKEAKVAGLREESITKSLNEIKARVVDTGPDEVKLRQFETEAKSKRAELERLQAQFEANRAKADSRAVPVEAQLVTKARAASVPVFPRKAPYSALVAFATFLFGLAGTITRALLTGARRQAPVDAPAARLRPEPLHPRAEPALANVRTIARSEPETAEMARAASPDTLHDAGGLIRIGSLPALARRIVAKGTGQGGFRTLVAGETETVSVAGVAAELTKSIADDGKTVILIDWCNPGQGVAANDSIEESVGLAELLAGEATFEDVVHRLPHSDAHIITCGEGALMLGGHLDPDRLNLVLDALDEAYDHIVIAGKHEAARRLFEAIEGRVDTGVLITDTGRRTAALQDPAGTFLGFEVADIDLIRFERAGGANPAQRLSKGSGSSQLSSSLA